MARTDGRWPRVPSVSPSWRNRQQAGGRGAVEGLPLPRVYTHWPGLEPCRGFDGQPAARTGVFSVGVVRSRPQKRSRDEAEVLLVGGSRRGQRDVTPAFRINSTQGGEGEPDAT
jgi:hypothetical protein